MRNAGFPGTEKRWSGTIARRGALAMMLVAGAAWANDIAVTNVFWNRAAETGQSYVNVKLSWKNSWRATWTEAGADNVTGSDLAVENWDAAWVFVKYRLGAGGEWKHATLSTNAGDYVTPVDATLSVGRTDNGLKGVGAFVYRAAAGQGDVNYGTVKLRWLHGADGLTNTNTPDLAVYAIEMVYVAGGPFVLGDGGNAALDSRFRAGGTVATPFLVNAAWDASSGTGPDARRIADQANRVWAAGNIVAGTLHDDFPTGYRAFYCMKYSVSQGQYASFLNSLTPLQAGNRAYTNGANRHTISVAGGVYSATAPDRASDFISWNDLAAYADWAGLRPMTELEYEKACRGPLNPVLNEFAWGTTTVTVPSGLQGIDGSGSEYYTAGNSRFDAAGPVRGGIFAKPNSTREQSGASYWGIMELSGNVATLVATLQNATGQGFRGLHGGGTLTAAGAASVSTWPAAGAGMRSFYWGTSSPDGIASARRGMGDVGTAGGRNQFNGGRAGRTAP